MKEERFPHTRKPLHRRRLWVSEGRSFRAMEDSASTGVQRAKWRDSHTEDPCRLSLTGLRGLSSHQLGGGGWELRLRLRRSDTRERTGVGCVNTA